MGITYLQKVSIESSHETPFSLASDSKLFSVNWSFDSRCWISFSSLLMRSFSLAARMWNVYDENGQQYRQLIELTLERLVGVQEQRAADLQFLLHCRILALQRADLLLALRELLLHLHVVLLLGGQHRLHVLPLVVHLGEQRVAALLRIDGRRLGAQRGQLLGQLQDLLMGGLVLQLLGLHLVALVQQRRLGALELVAQVFDGAL